MGKKSRNPGSATNNDGVATAAAAAVIPGSTNAARSLHPDAVARATAAGTAGASSPPVADVGATNLEEGPGWGRFKRSLIGMIILGFFAMSDLLVLKEGFTVAAPDNKPLLTVVVLFGWLVWKRWTSTDKKGLHPIIRALGFMFIFAAGLSLLPFNSTVTMYEVPLLTAEECHTLAEAAAATATLPGFVPTRSHFDPMTEVPLDDLPSEVSTMVSEALQERLMPFVSLEYGNQGIVALEPRDVYVEYYPSYHEPSISAHLRHGQLAFRVELTPPESKYVGGGGVVLDSMGRSVTPGMGSALVLPAKLRHGSSDLGTGTRSVLVGSLTVIGRDPWQRFVGMWHLWGLFARTVRYVADRRLSSSGVDTIPTPDPEPEKGGNKGDTAGVSPGEDGTKLEF